MSSIREFLSARDEYITRVKEELLGPGSEISIPDSEHELITNSPDVRYSIGILFPKNNKLNADSNDSSRVEEESGELPEDPSDEDEGTEGGQEWRRTLLYLYGMPQLPDSLCGSGNKQTEILWTFQPGCCHH